METIELSKINNIIQLKALKSDQYDIVANANNQVQLAQQNIASIERRIKEIDDELNNKMLQEPKKEEKDK